MAFQKAVKGTALIGGGAIATVFGLSQFSQYRNKHGTFVNVQAAEAVPVPMKSHLPTREQQILALQTTSEFDVLVIGGGATGCGCALDAVTRALTDGKKYPHAYFTAKTVFHYDKERVNIAFPKIFRSLI